MVDYFAKRIVENQRRPCEIKGVFPKPALPAQSFDRGRRHAALRAVGRLERFHPAPAGRAYGAPSSFPDWSVAKYAGERKKQIQNCVDHRQSPATQKAALLYHFLF